MSKTASLVEIFNRAGGLANVAKATGASAQEVRVWMTSGFVPVVHAAKVAEVAGCCPLDLIAPVVAREVRAADD